MMGREQVPSELTSIQRVGRYQGGFVWRQGSVTGLQLMLSDSAEREGSAVTLRDSLEAPRGRLDRG